MYKNGSVNCDYIGSRRPYVQGANVKIVAIEIALPEKVLQSLFWCSNDA